MKYFSIVLFSLFFIACNYKQSNQGTQKNKQGEFAQSQETAQTIKGVLSHASGNIGQEVYFRGTVNHVCSHSGKRCILKDPEGDLSIRVEATGKLKEFDKEIVGRDILVTGFLREKRLDASEIDEMELEIKAKQYDENNGESCESEMKNIREMRAWMKENNKNYYAIYYIDGTAYECVE